MTWVWFALTGTVIVVAGTWLARYGDVIAVRTGLGRHWVGVVLVAATTSLPELFTGFGATAVIQAPNIAIGDVLGSCLFNLLLLSFMDVVQAERLSARAHQGHALTIGCGLALTAIAGLGIAGARHWPTLGWVGAYSPLLIAGYLLSIRATFVHERRRLSEGHRAVAETVGDGVPALDRKSTRLNSSH